MARKSRKLTLAQQAAFYLRRKQADTLVVSPLNGKTYYVSGTGSDAANGLSTTTPKRTLQAVHALMVPGDTCEAMNGDYTNAGASTAVLEITTPGTAAAPITYRRYAGHNPRIVVGAQNWQGIWVKANYVVIDGFEVKGNAENITYAYAFAERNNTNNSSTSADGIICTGTDVLTRRNVTVRNCVVHHMPGAGIAAQYYDYVIFEDNRSYSNSWWTPYGTSGISLRLSKDVDADTISYKNTIRRNICYDNENFIGFIYAAGVITDGNGIIVDENKVATAYAGKTLVTNNLCFNNGGSGIHAFDSAKVDIINNTAYNNSRSPALNNGEIFANQSTTVNIHNNIMYARTSKVVTTNNSNSGVSYNYNIYYNGAAAVVGANDLNATDPKFVAPGIDPVTSSFRLQVTSPAIGSGTTSLAPSDDLVKSPRVGAIDRGAYRALAA